MAGPRSLSVPGAHQRPITVFTFYLLVLSNLLQLASCAVPFNFTDLPKKIVPVSIKDGHVTTIVVPNWAKIADAPQSTDPPRLLLGQKCK